MTNQQMKHFKALFRRSLLLLALMLPVVPANAQECARTHEVQITFEDATGFKPQTVVIHVGDCIRWINVAFDAHSVVAVDRSFRVGMLQNGADGIVAFAKAGEYPYFCGPHPPMRGKVIVEP